MTGKQDKPDVRLIIQIRREHGYSVVVATAEVCVMTEAGLRNPQWQGAYTAESSPADAYDSLQARAQFNADDSDSARRWYGWEVAYHQPYTVDLDRAASMVKVLKRVAAYDAKLDGMYGRAESFGQWLARVAVGLGCVASCPFGVKVPRERDITGTGYRWMDASSLACMLADELKVAERAA